MFICDRKAPFYVLAHLAISYCPKLRLSQKHERVDKFPPEKERASGCFWLYKMKKTKIKNVKP